MRLGLSVPLMGVIYLFALAVQLSMNIQLVTSFRTGSHLDLLGFVAMMVTGLVLAINELGRGTVRTRPILYLAAFGIYIALVIAFTSESSLIAVFLSKYGILTWVLAGTFASLAMNAISRRMARKTGVPGRWQLVAYSLPVVLLCIVLLPLRTYMASPHVIESYQFAAANATILFITALIAAAHWSAAKSRRAFLVEALMLVGLGTIITFLVSRMNSTSIVLVWVMLALIYVRWSKARLRVGYTLLLAGCLIGGGIWFLNTGMSNEFMETTRFRELAGGNMQLSSLTSRLDLLPTFWSQFSVSPLIGHFQAEIIAGYLPGEYVHSLPLSLLTHVGVLGTIIFVAATFSIMKVSGADSDLLGGGRQELSLVRHVFYGVLAAATLTTFFLWIPLWFMIGFLLVRPRSRGGASARMSALDHLEVRGVKSARLNQGSSPRYLRFQVRRAGRAYDPHS